MHELHWHLMHELKPRVQRLCEVHNTGAILGVLIQIYIVLYTHVLCFAVAAMHYHFWFLSAFMIIHMHTNLYSSDLTIDSLLDLLTQYTLSHKGLRAVTLAFTHEMVSGILTFMHE